MHGVLTIDRAGKAGGTAGSTAKLDLGGTLGALRLTLNGEATGAWGVPVVRVTYNVYENEYRMAAYLTEKMTAIHKAAGATMTWGGQIGAVAYASHAYGGTRLGDDPASSVVNRYSISHEAPNLAVMGGSTFLSTSGFNPTETIEALAWYGAEHIAKNFGAIAA